MIVRCYIRQHPEEFNREEIEAPYLPQVVDEVIPDSMNRERYVVEEPYF